MTRSVSYNRDFAARRSMENDVDDFFQTSFMESGAPLETETAAKLSQHFEVRDQPAFIDLDEGKSRDGDIVARETFPPASSVSSAKRMLAQLVLTVECKSLPDHGWIFTEGRMRQSIWHFSLIRGENSLLSNLRPTRPLHELRGTSNHLERILGNKKGERSTRSNGRTDNYYGSSLKVIKLTRDLINADLREAKSFYKYYNNRAEVVFFKLYQPLVVFNGHLYIRRVDENRISPVDYLQFSKQYRTKSYDEEATIHVVSSNHIQEYLNIVRTYYMTGLQYIVDHQSELAQAVKDDLIHWDDFNPFRINF
jgi:hypothetical protein